MSLRKLIELEGTLYRLGLRIALTSKPDGMFIEGPNYADRIIAMNELRKRNISVCGHAEKAIDMGATGMSAI